MSEAKVQNYKKEAVKALQEQFSNANDFFFADYRGMTVEQFSEIRSELRKNNAELHVVKNNFAKIAFSNLDHKEVEELLVGPTAVALAFEESGPVAKSLLSFGKEAPLELKGGLVSGDLFDAAKVEAFSKLPTKTELLAKLMATMNAPLQNMVYVMNGVTTKLVRTLAAVAEKKQQEG